MESIDNKVFKIAIDAMGGDFAPVNEVAGAISAFGEGTHDKNVEIIFVGKEDKIEEAISRFDKKDLKYSILHADDVVTMDDDPTEILKKKKNSSLYKGLELHAGGGADAFISVGNTGAVLSSATILLGRIQGVSRPTIGSFFPTVNPLPSLVLDVGANTVCKARYLYEFAVMGSIYTTQILGVENPKVGLLNIGEEKSKGTDSVREAHKMLSESQLNFIGNVEGRDILLGSADVVVCDGFTGNIILKFAESVFPFLKAKIKAFADKSFKNKTMTALAKPSLKKIFSEFDYQEYGGIPLLGVNGVVMIGHGKSSPKALKMIMYKTIDIIHREVNKKIEIALNPPKVKEVQEEAR